MKLLLAFLLACMLFGTAGLSGCTNAGRETMDEHAEDETGLKDEKPIRGRICTDPSPDRFPLIEP